MNELIKLFYNQPESLEIKETVIAYLETNLELLRNDQEIDIKIISNINYINKKICKDAKIEMLCDTIDFAILTITLNQKEIEKPNEQLFLYQGYIDKDDSYQQKENNICS